MWSIFEEDGYQEIALSQASGGDIAVYLTENPREVWHVGVIELRDIATEGGTSLTSVPWVLSKLNDTQGEVFHPLRDVHAPFHSEFVVKIWTDREY